MRINRTLVFACALLLSSACTRVVYQHRDMAGEEPTWGKPQIYRMTVNGWFKTNL